MDRVGDDDGARPFCCGACQHVEEVAQGKVSYPPSPPLILGAAGIALVIRRGSGQHRILLVARDVRLTIGRASTNDIQLDDKFVDRRACQLEITSSGEVFISDLNSACGTIVNGRKVDRAGLHERDAIQLGHTVLTFDQG